MEEVDKINPNRFEDLSDADIEVEWGRRFPGIHVSSLTPDLKRAYLTHIENKPEFESQLKEGLEAQEYLEKAHENFRLERLLMSEWGVL